MNAAELVDAYLAGVADLRAAVAGMTREQLVARPVAGKMSTLEVVAHVADMDVVMADRMKRIAAAPDGEPPLLLVADEERYLAALRYHDRDLEEELALVELTRRQMARLIRSLTPEQLQRPGVHSQKGLLSLAKVVQTATGHITHHLPFIADKRRALGIT